MKKVIFVLPCMAGGGAERVASQLLNKITDCGFSGEIVLTSQKSDAVVNSDLRNDIPIVSLADKYSDITFFNKLLILITSFFCKPFELSKLSVPFILASLSFKANYRNELKELSNYLRQHRNSTVVTFLQPSIPLVMLASKGLDLRIVFSERGDAHRLMRHRYGYNFIKHYYNRADVAVFQTLDAMLAYPETIARKGTVISNPVKENLPEAYHGERNKYITTFCRISKQKNLPLLLESFNIVHSVHPDYKLRIIGDALNDEGNAVKAELDEYIRNNNLADSVVFEPFRKDIHSAVIHDAMYVNSSDYEGISNAMLESMAIGLPVVCTDCLVGGAKQTIKDGVNGLLVPCNDASALSASICRIIENNDFAHTLSENASSLRDKLSLENIADEWINLL